MHRDQRQSSSRELARVRRADKGRRADAMDVRLDRAVEDVLQRVLLVLPPTPRDARIRRRRRIARGALVDRMETIDGRRRSLVRTRRRRRQDDGREAGDQITDAAKAEIVAVNDRLTLLLLDVGVAEPDPQIAQRVLRDLGVALGLPHQRHLVQCSAHRTRIHAAPARA